MALLLAAVAVTVTPWCSVLAALGAMLFLDGVSKGVLAAGGPLMCEDSERAFIPIAQMTH